VDIGRAIGGLAPFRAAELRYDGRPIRSRTPTEALRDGIVYLPADRRAEGLFLRLDVRQNIVASTLRELSLGPWMRDASAAETASQFVRSLRIRTPSLRQQVGNLSGGNQQKVVLARGLTVNSGLVIADDPTRGIDVGTKAEIYDLLRGLADAGKTVLLISSEVPELLAVCDRILVIRAGRVAAELPRAAASEERIMSLASGDFARAS
ncbi:MAG: ATP-binding cassette domain-containing protein, partial [Roseiarcus sp.]